MLAATDYDGTLERRLGRERGEVSTPMGVGGWESLLRGSPPVPSRRQLFDPECNDVCCVLWSWRVRRMAEVYGPAFFSDGMGV